MRGDPMFSVIIPVYKTAEFIPLLIHELEKLAMACRWEHGEELEAVFVVDGSPDESLAELSRVLPGVGFASQLIEHSRNFGSFAAIRTGLAAANGPYFAVIAADLQEPPGLLLDFLRELCSGMADVVVGRRKTRHDPAATK